MIFIVAFTIVQTRSPSNYMLKKFRCTIAPVDIVSGSIYVYAHLPLTLGPAAVRAGSRQRETLARLHGVRHALERAEWGGDNPDGELQAILLSYHGDMCIMDSVQR